MMTDYKPLKVPELKSLLQERSLPVSGNKAELIARLEEHDKSKSQPAETKPAPATSAAIAPPVEDEIDWDDEGTTTAPTTKAPTAKATTAPATKATITPAAAATATARKGQVESTVKAPTPKPAIDPSKTNDLTVKLPEKKKETPVTTEKKGAEAAASQSTTESASEAPAVKNYAAGLAASNVIDELEKRKQRAIKFGKQADVDEANKALERAKKFGAAAAEDSKAGEGVKGLDSALPTRELRGKKRHAEGGDEDDNRKRGRGGPRGGRRQQGTGGRRGGSGGRGGQSQPQQQKNTSAPNKKGGAGNKPAATKGKITDDPVEKAKAEARAKKFAIAA
jgi:SAP domain-containing ribonucleoprotein